VPAARRRRVLRLGRLPFKLRRGEHDAAAA
jgi:hypothetical protein